MKLNYIHTVYAKRAEWLLMLRCINEKTSERNLESLRKPHSFFIRTTYDVCVKNVNILCIHFGAALLLVKIARVHHIKCIIIINLDSFSAICASVNAVKTTYAAAFTIAAVSSSHYIYIYISLLLYFFRIKWKKKKNKNKHTFAQHIHTHTNTHPH